MANHTGTSGLVKVGTNTIAEVRSFTINTTSELLEDTTLTDTSKTYQVEKKVAQFLWNVFGMKQTLMDR